ncbi:DNA replication/repair protein RecF [Dehalococcoidia bacterium]|nr:DNA replication/repair protein RecF [Dehalococcoidia bacterium]
MHIYISRLGLINFRGYERLDLDLQPGLILVEGDNGQGKSNLLEAIYLLAIAKSCRASVERELVRRGALSESEFYAQVMAEVDRTDGVSKLQADFSPIQPPLADGVNDNLNGLSFRKSFRINGVGRLASNIIGILNAVMFRAEDLELVYGNPSVRRRHLDILISQLDDRYLRSLQRYQKVLAQRNQLLKQMRRQAAGSDELRFWDEELVSVGAYIMDRRAETLEHLDTIAAPLHSILSGTGEHLRLIYQPSVNASVDAGASTTEERIAAALDKMRDRELLQGFTLVGPHRDDLRSTIDEMDAYAYASRGQARTIVVSMKLAEAEHLKARRGQEPVMLLDDVLSELDARRRSLVIDRIGEFQQCFVTTAEVEAFPNSHVAAVCRYRVKDGTVQRVQIPV